MEFYSWGQCWVHRAMENTRSSKILSLFFSFFKILTVLHSLWDLSSPTRDWTGALGSECGILTTGPPGNSHHYFIFKLKSPEWCVLASGRSEQDCLKLKKGVWIDLSLERNPHRCLLTLYEKHSEYKPTLTRSLLSARHNPTHLHFESCSPHYGLWGKCSCHPTLGTRRLQPRVVVSFANIFFHSEVCLFTLLVVSFVVQKLLSLIRYHLFIFTFIFITLGGES